ncbi:MAG: hypothetical protein R2729_31535 [Bryobacteraceae bacterium]
MRWIVALACAAALPAAVPVPAVPVPGSGSGAAGVFTFAFEDTQGAADIAIANVLINNALDGRIACYVAYVAASNTLFLVNNAGEAGGPFAGSLLFTGAGSVSNGQCTVNGAGSSVTASGTTLTLVLNISFAPGFAGRRLVYLGARDQAASNSGWHAKGVWEVPGGTPAGNGTAVVSLSPARADTQTVVFTGVFSDTAGFADLGVINILINDFVDGLHACYFALVPATGQLYLVNNAGDAAGPYAGVINLVSGPWGLAVNSQCSIATVGSSVTGSGNAVTAVVNMHFHFPFNGDKIVWAAARDQSGNNTGWQPMATISIP